MLSGPRRVHPVIVGWSTANRPLMPKPINIIPLPHGLGQLREKVGGDVAPRHCMVVRTESFAHPIGTTQGRPAHDQWTKLR